MIPNEAEVTRPITPEEFAEIPALWAGVTDESFPLRALGVPDELIDDLQAVAILRDGKVHVKHPLSTAEKSSIVIRAHHEGFSICRASRTFDFRFSLMITTLQGAVMSAARQVVQEGPKMDPAVPATPSIAQAMSHKFLTHDEIRSLGVLQEVNRLLLHPRGLAMCIISDKGKGTSVIEVMDWRDDPEGAAFDFESIAVEPAKAKAAAFEQLLLKDREAALGYVIQPIRPENEIDKREINCTRSEPA